MNQINKNQLGVPMRKNLLDWYSYNKRELPWRQSDPDPYHVMLSEFMLQQTTVTAVAPYYEKFLQKWPHLKDLSNSQDDEVMAAWAGLGYYSRARNLLKAARQIDQMDEFPKNISALKKLSGIGDYTAAAIAAIAFGATNLPIDGNVKRVLARFHGIDDLIDRPSKALQNASHLWENDESAGDLAQAFMDLGATICRPKNPNCDLCPLRENCLAYRQDRIAELPKKSPKRAKKQWKGHAYIIETSQGVAFEKREAGLLGNMYGLPSQMGELTAFNPPFNGDWQKIGDIQHVFTHVQLCLTIWRIRLDPAPLSNVWNYFDKSAQKDVASLWRKSLELAEETHGEI